MSASVRVLGRDVPIARCATADKVRYRSQADAQRAALHMLARQQRSLKAYSCNACDGWHLAHRVKR